MLGKKIHKNISPVRYYFHVLQLTGQVEFELRPPHWPSRFVMLSAADEE